MADWDWTTPHKCPICGKNFWVTSKTGWSYKRKSSQGLVFMCSWSCLLKFDEKAEKERFEKAVRRKKKNAQHGNGNCGR